MEFIKDEFIKEEYDTFEKRINEKKKYYTSHKSRTFNYMLPKELKNVKSFEDLNLLNNGKFNPKELTKLHKEYINRIDIMQDYIIRGGKIDKNIYLELLNSYSFFLKDMINYFKMDNLRILVSDIDYKINKAKELLEKNNKEEMGQFEPVEFDPFDFEIMLGEAYLKKGPSFLGKHAYFSKKYLMRKHYNNVLLNVFEYIYKEIEEEEAKKINKEIEEAPKINIEISQKEEIKEKELEPEIKKELEPEIKEFSEFINENIKLEQDTEEVKEIVEYVTNLSEEKKKEENIEIKIIDIVKVDKEKNSISFKQYSQKIVDKFIKKQENIEDKKMKINYDEFISDEKMNIQNINYKILNDEEVEFNLKDYIVNKYVLGFVGTIFILVSGGIVVGLIAKAGNKSKIEIIKILKI